VTAAFSHEDFFKAVEPVIDAILSTRPAQWLADQVPFDDHIKHPAYLQSAAIQLRRRLLANPRISRLRKLITRDLPHWLGNHEALGPYERNLLATLLYSGGKVMILRGGTGSGKSSTLAALGHYVEQNALPSPQLAAAYGCNASLFVVNLQHVDDRIRHQDPEAAFSTGGATDAANGGKRGDQSDLTDAEKTRLLAIYFAKCVLESIEEAITDANFRKLIFDSANRPLYQSFAADNSSVMQGELRRHLRRQGLTRVRICH